MMKSKMESPTSRGSGESTGEREPGQPVIPVTSKAAREQLSKRLAKVLSQKKRVSGDATGKGQPAQAMIPALPAEARKQVIDVIVAWAGDWVQSRAEEILKEPWLYGDNLEEVRDKICDAVEGFRFMYKEPLDHLIWDAYVKAGMHKTAGSKQT